jgi:hypothetical protein
MGSLKSSANRTSSPLVETRVGTGVNVGGGVGVEVGGGVGVEGGSVGDEVAVLGGREVAASVGVEGTETTVEVLAGKVGVDPPTMLGKILHPEISIATASRDSNRNILSPHIDMLHS